VKFVLSEDKSVAAEVVEWASKRGFELNQIFFMPEGITREIQLQRGEKVLSLAWEQKVNFSPRLHVLLYDQAKLV